MQTMAKWITLAASIGVPSLSHAHVGATSNQLYYHASTHLIEIMIVVVIAYCSLQVWRKRSSK